ncbi:MAG: hypothetical protein LBJ57_03875, partial [Prevotellaceae bacterium]|nr:hypothetical protein [Prevotellaceae bacterium]
EYKGIFPGSEYLGWYAAAGLKLGYAVMGNSNASIRLITEARLYPENILINKDRPIEDLGWGVTVNENVDADLRLGFSSAAYLEAGFTQQLTQKYTLYAGFFGEYSLYSIVGSTASVMMEYEPVSGQDRYYNFRYNPAANVSTIGVKSNYLLSFGVTVRIGLTFNKRVTQRNERLFNVRYFQY